MLFHIRLAMFLRKELSGNLLPVVGVVVGGGFGDVEILHHPSLIQLVMQYSVFLKVPSSMMVRLVRQALALWRCVLGGRVWEMSGMCRLSLNRRDTWEGRVSPDSSQ